MANALTLARVKGVVFPKDAEKDAAFRAMIEQLCEIIVEQDLMLSPPCDNVPIMHRHD